MIPPVTQAPGNRGPSWTPTLTLAAKPPVSNRRPTPPSPRHLPPDNTWCWALWGLRENPSSQQRAALPRQPGGSTACPSPPPRALSSWRRGSQASAPQPGAQQGPVGGALCPVTTLLVWADLLPPRWPGRPLPLPEPEASEGSREAPERRQELEPPASWKPLGGSSQRVWEPRGHPGCWRDGQGCPGWLCGQGATSVSRARWVANVRALVAPIHLPLAQRQPGAEVPDDQPGNPCKATRCPHHRAP